MTQSVNSTTPTTGADGLVEGLYRLGAPIKDTKAPAGPIEGKWAKRKFEAKLVNPANRRKLHVIIVGTGLAGSAAAATLGEAGYHVNACFYRVGGDPSSRTGSRQAGAMAVRRH